MLGFCGESVSPLDRNLWANHCLALCYVTPTYPLRLAWLLKKRGVKTITLQLCSSQCKHPQTLLWRGEHCSCGLPVHQNDRHGRLWLSRSSALINDRKVQGSNQGSNQGSPSLSVLVSLGKTLNSELLPMGPVTWQQPPIAVWMGK